MPLLFFLDSKDLIHLVRRDIPFSVAEADAWLRKRAATIVLSQTSVSEFIPVATTDRLQVRRELQQLEKLPITYMRLGDLRCPELTNAVAAFARQQPYTSIGPFVKRFWQTFWSYDPTNGHDITLTRHLERQINFPLHEQVFMLWSRPANFMNTQADADRMQQILERQRRQTPQQRFRDDLRTAFETCNRRLREDAFEQFAKWLDDKPKIAPSWRLFWQVSEELTLNHHDRAKPGDVNDLTHVSTTPYVDGVTLDGRFLNYTRQATAKLRRLDPTIDYERKLFRSFAEIVQHYG